MPLILTVPQTLGRTGARSGKQQFGCGVGMAAQQAGVLLEASKGVVGLLRELGESPGEGRLVQQTPGEMMGWGRACGVASCP